MIMQRIEIPRSFKDSVLTIVRCEGRKGHAVDSLAKLYSRVVADYERAKGTEAEALLKAEMHFVEGFMEGPAACLHDIRHIKKVKS